MIKKSLTTLISLVIASTACELQAADTVSVPAAVMTQSASPNDYGKSLTTPVAWGAGAGTIFFGAGATSRVPYVKGPAFSTHVGDAAAAVGFGLGNPEDFVGLQTSLTQYDISQFNVWGMSFQMSRTLTSSQAIAVGVQEIMLSKGENVSRSYYAVYSQGLLPNSSTGKAKLHYSLGVGKGLYSDKPLQDQVRGKGEHGSYVFGNVAYELFNEFNVISDWNGMNLNAGVSKTFFLTKSIPLVITVGAADLTRNTGEDARMIIGVGTGINL